MYGKACKPEAVLCKQTLPVSRDEGRRMMRLPEVGLPLRRLPVPAVGASMPTSGREACKPSETL